MRLRPLLVLPLALASVLPARAAAPGPVLASVLVRSAGDLALLQRMDLTEHRVGDRLDVVLWPGDAATLRSHGLSFRVLGGVDAAAPGERPARAEERATYRVLADYEREIADLGARYPGLARVVEGAHPSLEGRTVYGLEVAADVERQDGRPTSFVMGLHHSREWPSAELTMDLAIDLLESYGTDPRITSLLDRVRILLVPVVNPDGFAYSRDALVSGASLVGEASYWRKNRRGVAHLPQQHVSLGTYGVDPNRNYSYLWGSGSYVPLLDATSSLPADDTYQGAGPFSEPETQNVRDWFLERNVLTLLTNHTYGREVLWPWGDRYEPAPDAAALEALGESMASSAGYRGMTGAELYPTTGATEDWAYAIAGTLGYTMELGQSFHPSYPAVQTERERTRDAFLRLIEAAANPSWHAIVRGAVVDGSGTPIDATLTLSKTVQTPISHRNNDGLPVVGEDVPERIAFSMRTGTDGSFTWHVNPSTAPIETSERAYTLTVRAPGYQDRTLSVTVARGQVRALGLLTLTAA